MSAACLFPLRLSPFSITPSPLLIPLADPQRETREWVGLKREGSAVLYPTRSSLARLKHGEEEEKNTRTQHTREESLSLSLLFSILHLSTLLSRHSWVVWYLTFILLQQGLESKSSEHKFVSPLSKCYTSISIPASSLFLALSVAFSSSVFKQTITEMFSALQAGKGEKICRNSPTNTHIFTNNVRCMQTDASARLFDGTVCASFFFWTNYWFREVKTVNSVGLDIHLLKIQCSFVT